MAAGDQEEVGVGNVAAELGAVLAEALVNPILAGEEVAAVDVGAPYVVRGDADASL